MEAEAPADRAGDAADLPARAYVCLAALFGAFLLVATPPLQVPDETAHLLRAWAIAHGQPLAEQGGFRGFLLVLPEESLRKI